MDFVQFVENELSKREWSRSDLARKSGITPTQITRVLSRKQNPGNAFCEGIARAFNIPLEQVYRVAGVLSNKSESDELDDEAMYLMQQLKSKEKKRLAIKLIKTLSDEDGGVSSRHVME